MTRAAQLAGLGSLEGSAPAYACRAWVNFNGTGTVAIRGSGNVSSITDNGTGNYTVHFTIAFIDNIYAATCSFNRANANDFLNTGWNQTTTYTNVETFSNGNLADMQTISLAFFR